MGRHRPYEVTLIKFVLLLGSLGGTPESWLFGDFARSLSEKETTSTFPVDVIYPSFNNVKQSHDGLAGGGCLPYQSSTHFKQLWLRNHLKYEA